jgi:hypothetical protein
MATGTVIQLQIRINTAEGVAAVEKIIGSVGNLGGAVEKVKSPVNALEDSFTKLGLRLQGMQNLFRIVAGSFGSFIRQSNEQEAATARLAKALDNVGVFSQSALQSLTGYARMREELTGIEASATVAIMAQLTAMGFQGEELRRVTDLSQDLATVMEVDLKTAARLVGKAMQDGGEELKRYGISLDNVKGQAVDAGQTAAGAMRRFDTALKSLRESFGDLIKHALLPVLEKLNGLVKLVSDLPASAQALALAIGALGAAFVLFNSQLTTRNLLLAGSVGVLFTWFTAIRDGQGYLYALLGTVGFAVIMFAQMQGSLIASTVALDGLSVGFKIAGLAAKEFLASLGPIGWIAIALGAAATVFFAFSQRTDEATKRLKEFGETVRNLPIPDLKERIIGVFAEMVALNEQLERQSEIDRVASVHGTNRVSADQQKLRDQLAEKTKELEILRTALRRAEQREREKLLEEQEANDPKIQIQLERLRVEAMEESTQKKLALLDVEKQQQYQRWDEENLSVKQRNDLKTAYEQAYQTKRTQIVRDAFEKERQLRQQSEDEYAAYVEFLRTLDQELALDSAVTDEERYNLKRQFLLKEIADLEALGVRTLEEEKKLASARAELKKLENAEDRRLQQERLEVERQMRDLRLGDVMDDHRRELESVREKYARLRELAIKHGKDITDVDRAEAAEQAALRKRQTEEIRVQWERNNQFAVAGVNAVVAGYTEAFNQMFLKQRQAKDEADAVWLAIRNTALSAIRDILATQLRSYIIDALAFGKAETVKTGTQATGSATRTGISLGEAAAKMAGWVAEAATFIASQVAMTASAIANAAVRIATFLAEIAAAIAKAVANFITSLGPFGLLAAGGAIALGVVVLSQLKKAFGFEKGGEFEPGQRGFIEGGQYELIAPKRTFIDVISQDIMPEVAAAARRQISVMVQSQQPELAFAGIDRITDRLDLLNDRLNELHKTTRRKETSVAIRGTLSGQKFYDDEIPSAELKRRRRLL